VHLSRLAEEVGFAVAVACPESDRDRLGDTVKVAGDFDEVDGDFVVIATQGRSDKAAIRAALNSSAQHLAMVASAKKSAGIKAQLIEAGMCGADLERIQSPAGVSIGAVTPAEVALSVLAELVEQRRAAGWRADSKQAAPSAIAATNPAKGGCCGG
jgi:xanthine dehydrogenase accessory factor